MAGARNIGRAAAHSAAALAGAVGSRSASRSGACSAVAAGSLVQFSQALMWALGDDNGATVTLTMSAAADPADVTAGIASTRNVQAGSTILVFITDEDFNGSPAGSGAPYSVSISDSQGGTTGNGAYANLGYVADQFDLDSLQLFARTNVSAGALAVTTNWTTNQWHGVCVVEIANAGPTPTLTFFGNLNVNPSGTDSITTGTHALGSAAALLMALAYNATDIAPSDGYPSAGSGFTSQLVGWDWFGKESTSSNNIAQLESQYLANPGTVAATFTPRTPGPNPEDFLAIAVAIKP